MTCYMYLQRIFQYFKTKMLQGWLQEPAAIFVKFQEMTNREMWL